MISSLKRSLTGKGSVTLLMLPLVLFVFGPVSAQPSEVCPLIPACCEEDCCGLDTVWETQACVASPGSPGWNNVYSDAYQTGCTLRACCEQACCGGGTSWDVATSFCVLMGLCSNGVVDNGEDCDPPGPLCTSLCRFAFSNCPVNTYSSPSGCVECPPNSSTPPGATSIDDCTCDEGYVPKGDGSCSPCPANTFEIEGVCEPCPDGQDSIPGGSSCSGCGDGIVDSDEECDDGPFNGNFALSDCTFNCLLTSTPRGCCLTSDQCLNNVLEEDCPSDGTFGAFGVCGSFSPECPFDDGSTPSPGPLCEDSPEECEVDINECVSSTCNTTTNQCDYTVDPAFQLVGGTCVPLDDPQCTSDNPPCPPGQTETTSGCCEPCPPGFFESFGLCYACPENTTAPESSFGISSCFEPDICPTAAPGDDMGGGQRRRLGICDDDCTPVNARQSVTLLGLALKNKFSPVSPGAVADLAGAVEALNLLSNVANVAAIGAGAAQGTAQALLEASRAFVDAGTSGNLATAVLNGALALEPILQRRNGAAIWINLSAECCLSTTCCIFWSNNEWVETEKWHKCSACPRGGIAGLGFMPGDAAGIAAALPGCVAEAVRAFTCP